VTSQEIRSRRYRTDFSSEYFVVLALLFSFCTRKQSSHFLGIMENVRRRTDVGFETGTSEDDWVVVSGNAMGSETGDDQEELKVEFFSPAEYWTDALPVGNGRLGAMVWGGVQSDLLQLNGTFECHLSQLLFFSFENAYE
jgi:hypothetical protein